MELARPLFDATWFTVPGREAADAEAYAAWLDTLSPEARGEEYRATLQGARALLANCPAEQLPGRNDPCTCGSGVKYKKCCGK
jgi:uncharacterized protein YecA (UPF0149 family)